MGEQDAAATRWLYAGIDEAGYGPVLGPLCVGLSVFEMERPLADGAAAPDLWKLLRRGVSRTPSKSGRGRRLPIADSKALKLPNPKPGDETSRDPLMHLERGVLAMLRAQEVDIDCVEGLMGALGAAGSDLAWYARAGAEQLPRSTTREHIRMYGAHLAQVMTSAGVRARALRCHCMDEARFNASLEQAGVKSVVSFGAVGMLLRELWAQADVALEACPRVVIDRQGGRTSYGEALAEALPDASIEAVSESAARSVYVVRSRSGAPARAMRVHFEVEAERRHLPVALASMVAKLVRELMMARLNAHFGARMVELKPTAGYYSDGVRWLRDADGILTDAEKQTLRRRA